MSRADAGRLIHLSKRRERAKEDMQQQLKKMEEESTRRSAGISSKFTANYDAVEEHLKSKTVGLVTLDEMREKQKDMSRNVEVFVLEVFFSLFALQKRVLSFAFEDEEEDEELPIVTKKRVGMDPTIDTSFLPDKDREAEIAKYVSTHELLLIPTRAGEKRRNYSEGKHNLAIPYVGSCLSQFPLICLLQVLKKEFTELRTCVSENLMFVKEDLIIPHFYTFQDFIVTKAMGKTGPLYEFDAAGDVRIRQDAALDCGEAHPAKVVLRSWYEKNKHIYPASRWEPFVPNKKYGRTIDDLSTI
ncbi:unnamed protein product [Angiostrongylus costaricensis]|uniref:Protein FAM50 homolog n=1 Tax=Angiostrongylus costaricensis TaxID=334426 RepID=A0A0R3PVJ9_ANGCS|nr:unnamed protein product [Angiostrongylus costaricensis]